MAVAAPLRDFQKLTGMFSNHPVCAREGYRLSSVGGGSRSPLPASSTSAHCISAPHSCGQPMAPLNSEANMKRDLYAEVSARVSNRRRQHTMQRGDQSPVLRVQRRAAVDGAERRLPLSALPHVQAGAREGCSKRTRGRSSRHAARRKRRQTICEAWRCATLLRQRREAGDAKSHTQGTTSRCRLGEWKGR